MTRTATAHMLPAAFAALALASASGCSREPNRSDYVSSKVAAHCSDPETRRACRLQVIRHYAGVSIEEFQRTEERPHLRSVWCFFQKACIPGSPGWPPAVAAGPPSASRSPESDRP